MAKDFLVSLGIGVAVQASAKTVFRSTIKRLDDLSLLAREPAWIAGYSPPLAAARNRRA